jgi:hypothetical protein
MPREGLTSQVTSLFRISFIIRTRMAMAPILIVVGRHFLTWPLQVRIIQVKQNLNYVWKDFYLFLVQIIADWHIQIVCPNGSMKINKSAIF